MSKMAKTVAVPAIPLSMDDDLITDEMLAQSREKFHELDKAPKEKEPKKVRVRITKGGPGSGFHGHAGRPGEVGGSQPAQYVRVKLSLTTGNRIMWAKKLGDNKYLEVHSDGSEWFGEGDKQHLYIVNSADVLRETPAMMNLTYGELEVEEPVEESKFRKYQTKGRFVMEPSENIPGGWMIIDNVDGFLVDFENKSKAYAALKFARKYVKRWGDIHFGSFPYAIDQPLLSLEELEEMGMDIHDLREKQIIVVVKGGEGSGFHGHQGRPGLVGGSTSQNITMEDIRSNAERDWYYTTMGYMIESPASLEDWHTYTYDELKNLPKDTKISVKYYTAKRGGAARKKILLDKLILET